MKRFLLIDGNNQFFLKYPKAMNYQQLVMDCISLHRGFDAVYWVFDGYDSRKKRRDIYPEYKNTASRNKNKLDTTKYDMLNTFKREDLPTHGGVYIVEAAQIEADDLIRKLARILANGENYVEIASNDVDLLDTSVLPRVSQPQAKLPAFVKDGVELITYKALVGDSSDNIKGCPAFGEKAWETLSQKQRDLIGHQLKHNFDKFYHHYDFDLEDKKVARKVKALEDNWETIKMYYKVVNYIDVPDDVLMENIRYYASTKPKTPPQLMKMD